MTVCEGPERRTHFAAATTAGGSSWMGLSFRCRNSKKSRTFQPPRTICRRCRSHSGSGCCFASLDPVAPLEEYFRRNDRAHRLAPLEQFQPEPSRNREFVVRANWALYIDNYLEGFHIPYIHAALNEQLDYDNYEVELLQHGVLQLGVADDASDAFELPRSSPDYRTENRRILLLVLPEPDVQFLPVGLVDQRDPPDRGGSDEGELHHATCGNRSCWIAAPAPGSIASSAKMRPSLKRHIAG